MLTDRGLSCGAQMDWMASFLESGELAGKIVCPNKRCGAKLGNFDWAGVRCGCNEWVVPVRRSSVAPCRRPSLMQKLRPQGFCVHRSKVDEIVT